MRGSASILVLLTLLSGCTADRERKNARLEPVELTVSDGVEWTGGSLGEPAIATVGGIPIPASRLKGALARAEAGTDPEDVVRKVVEDEVVAQAAVREAGGRVAVSGTLLEQVLAGRLLRERFVEQLAPSDIPRSDLEGFFRVPAVSSRFDHLTLFRVYDFQTICCLGEKSECESPKAAACFREGRDTMLAVRRALVARTPDSEDVPHLFPELRPSFPGLGYQEYAFAVDLQTRKQKGSSLFDDAIVAEVLVTREGEFGQPVRTKFGWHVPFVWKIEPEQHLGLADPTVDAEVRKAFFLRFQYKRYMDLVLRLLPVKKFETLAPVFAGFEPEHPPEWDVDLYPEQLEIVSEKGKEPEGL